MAELATGVNGGRILNQRRNNVPTAPTLQTSQKQADKHHQVIRELAQQARERELLCSSLATVRWSSVMMASRRGVKWCRGPFWR